MARRGFSRTQAPAVDIARLDHLISAWDDGIFDEAAELLPMLEQEFIPAGKPPNEPDVGGKDTATTLKTTAMAKRSDPADSGESMPSGIGSALAA